MKKTLASILTLFYQLSFAITFHAEISSDPNAPSPESLVIEALLSPPPPSFTLQAFNVMAPTNVNYLIKIRAIGNLRTIMDNNPDWERAQLQQYISLTYTNGADVAAIQASLDNDVFVIHAYHINEEDLPKLSVPYPNHSINDKRTSPVGKSSSMININGSDIQSAWELSEGMGYVGISDTGLQINHPDLRAFDGSDNYVGGNLLDGFYQLDFANIGDAIDLNVDELEPVPAIGDFADCDSVDETQIMD